MKQSIDNWKRQLGDPAQQDLIEFYPVMINFTNFKDAGERRFFLNLPTSFVLPGTDVDKLVAPGAGCFGRTTSICASSGISAPHGPRGRSRGPLQRLRKHHADR